MCYDILSQMPRGRHHSRWSHSSMTITPLNLDVTGYDVSVCIRFWQEIDLPGINLWLTHSRDISAGNAILNRSLLLGRDFHLPGTHRPSRRSFCLALTTTGQKFLVVCKAIHGIFMKGAREGQLCVKILIEHLVRPLSDACRDILVLIQGKIRSLPILTLTKLFGVFVVRSLSVLGSHDTDHSVLCFGLFNQSILCSFICEKVR